VAAPGKKQELKQINFAALARRVIVIGGHICRIHLVPTAFSSSSRCSVEASIASEQAAVPSADSSLAFSLPYMACCTCSIPSAMSVEHG
jgi:hypothetical protein